MLPMLAHDYVASKLRFPLLLQPKIDGVRGLNLLGTLTGRSLKTHKNKFTTEFYSHPSCLGLDGELAANEETHPDLCRLTTSAVGTIAGEPFLLWHPFDFVNSGSLLLPYHRRLELLESHYKLMVAHAPQIANRVKPIKTIVVNNSDDMHHQEVLWLAAGYEGAIIRDPDGLYKQGRSTPTEGGLLRIKRFAEAEAVVSRVIEGDENLNEAKVNETGHTSRSSHQENMVPNGMVGALECVDCKTGKTITVAAGRMTHVERKHFFEHPELIINKTIKYKTFLKGVKDLPRFPTYQCIRVESDL